MRQTFLSLLAAWLFFFAAQAKGEGALMQTEPAANAEVSGFDGKVRAWFSGNVTDRSPSLLVVDGQGNRMDKRDVSLHGDGSTRSELSVSTQVLPPGPYVVRYRVLTRDGLVVSGIFRFTVKS